MIYKNLIHNVWICLHSISITNFKCLVLMFYYLSSSNSQIKILHRHVIWYFTNTPPHKKMHIFQRSVTIHHSKTQITCWQLCSHLTHSCIHHTVVTDQRKFTRIALACSPVAKCSYQILWNSVTGSKVGIGTPI